MHTELEGCRFNWHTDGRLANPAYDSMVSTEYCQSINILPITNCTNVALGKNRKRLVADVFLLHIGLKICNDSAAGVWSKLSRASHLKENVTPGPI